MADTLLASIIMPVKNGVFWLKDTLPFWLSQQVNGQYELILIDSGSTDALEELLQSYPSVKHHKIDPKTFNHGSTRNLGVGWAKGEYVVMTVQDAKPINEYWLQELLNGFLDSDVAAACGQQIVPHHADKNPVEWFRPISADGMRRVQLELGEIEKLSSTEQRQLACIDNVNTCYRKDKLLEIPFRNTLFAEDAYWAKDALCKGWAIVYNTKAKVEHYHHYTDATVYRNRIIYEWLSKYKIFGLLPSKVEKISFKSFVRYLWLINKSFPFSIPKIFYWLKYNFFLEKESRRAYKIWMNAYQNNDLEPLFDNKMPVSGR